MKSLPTKNKRKQPFAYFEYCKMCRWLDGTYCTKRKIDVSRYGFLMQCEYFEAKSNEGADSNG